MESLKNKAYSKSESNISSKNSPKNNIIIKSLKDNYNYNNQSNLNRNMFQFIFIIGKGGFGKVWRVQEKKTKELYALKEMSKTKIIDKKSEKSINGEREFLSYLHHPFIVNMHYAFQDHDNLYLVMDLLTGGDLRYHCSRYRSFSEEQTRFFLACIIHSLSYIHKNNVIHRDIKPENLVLDDKGYARITDFGIAKINMKDNSSETSGTPGYMCPEVMYGKNHSFPADYFSIGVIGYEFMMGKRPYRGRGRKEIKEQMISYQAKIGEDEIKDGWSIESVDFINGLLKRKEKKRLGSKKGVKELMEHPWMKYYPWKELSNKSLPAPFIPEKIDNFDKKYCESIDEISEDTQLRYDEIILATHFITAFTDFYYNKNEKMNTKNETEEVENSEEEEEKENNNDDTNKDKQTEKNSDKEEYIENKIKNIINKDINSKNNENEIIKDVANNSKIIQKQIINNEFFKSQGQNKLNTIKMKRLNRKENQFFLPKNNSDLNLINNNKNNNLNSLIINPKDKTEAKKTGDNFMNVKRISANNQNNISKIINQKKIDKTEKYILKPNKFNNIKFNKPIRNIFNINRNEIHNINNNNSNINVYLSINMFNKMLNNHLNNNNKKIIKERNPIQELLYKQKQLMIIENKKKSLDNKFKGIIQKSYINNINNYNKNKLFRSNSVGLFINKNLNYSKNNNNNFYKKIIGPNIFNYNNSKNKNFHNELFHYNYIK